MIIRPTIISLFFCILYVTVSAQDPYEVEGLDGVIWERIKDGDDRPDQPVTDFGMVANGSSVTKQYRLTNLSGNSLKISSIEFRGSSAFTTPFVGPKTVAPGGVETFTIKFDAGRREELAEVGVLTDAGDDFEVFTFHITGEGVPRILHVDSTATGTNDGSSWANAFVKLQDAVATATSADDGVLVAAGIYYPDEGGGQTNNDRNSSFSIPDGLVIRGGYPVGGGALDPDTNTTILSGDLQQNDVNLDGNFIAESPDHLVGGNAYSVVTIEGQASLSGFTITAGLADGATTGASESGAGVYGQGSAAEPLDLILEHCHVIGCSSIITSTNSAASGGGSALWIDDGDVQLRDCLFTNNLVTAGVGITGGTCRIDGEVRMVKIRNCEFRDNEAVVMTGGNSNGVEFSVGSDRDDGECLVADTIFSGHHDDSGKNGLCRLDDLASVRIERCHWVDNRAVDLMSLRDCATSVIESSAFTGNEVDDLILLNVNVALTVLNTTIAGNDANQVFRTIAASTSGTISIGNSVIVEALGTLEPNIDIFRSNSLVSGFPADGSGNLDPATDPLFINAPSGSAAPTATGDYRLQSASPLIDAGLNASNPATLDLDRLPRVIDGVIDIGAYETEGPPQISITGIDYNPANGEVNLTVEASAATSYTAQKNPDLKSANWGGLFSGQLTAGTNTIMIAGAEYDWPAGRVYFRLLSPAGGG